MIMQDGYTIFKWVAYVLMAPEAKLHLTVVETPTADFF